MLWAIGIGAVLGAIGGAIWAVHKARRAHQPVTWQNVLGTAATFALTGAFFGSGVGAIATGAVTGLEVLGVGGLFGGLVGGVLANAMDPEHSSAHVLSGLVGGAVAGAFLGPALVGALAVPAAGAGVEVIVGGAVVAAPVAGVVVADQVGNVVEHDKGEPCVVTGRDNDPKGNVSVACPETGETFTLPKPQRDPATPPPFEELLPDSPAPCPGMVGALDEATCKGTN
jgi:hypothetical protein